MTLDRFDPETVIREVCHANGVRDEIVVQEIEQGLGGLESDAPLEDVDQFRGWVRGRLAAAGAINTEPPRLKHPVRIPEGAAANA